jgi:hypothetical protein
MPPQQSDRLLGGVHERFDLGAHLEWVLNGRGRSGVLRAGARGVHTRAALMNG